MGDEGAGIHVIRHLQKHHALTEADLLAGGTGGFYLLEYFHSYERIIIVDASMDGKAHRHGNHAAATVLQRLSNSMPLTSIDSNRPGLETPDVCALYSYTRHF